ncbi:uncharacterized protein BDZ99DRAFT_464150 [Mytilinidion resinicola]|uniref:BTB domain-containing protein n=1 Tax=Mytilinidion resinicola TaxID=574789 RepID=A0A6A6YHM0_9PEZI|nr:uncharacterized protein BDZ99DRAFT_464150 [Mytilinidion resinicola]KAF2808260.1 hypothetical protein BDZ99DRAFT_464150 [Mytilinidion resinicola]
MKKVKIEAVEARIEEAIKPSRNSEGALKRDSSTQTDLILMEKIKAGPVEIADDNKSKDIKIEEVDAEPAKPEKMIEVVVGRYPERRWYLPKNLLGQHSSFFNADKVYLPKEYPTCFEAFVRFMNTGLCYEECDLEFNYESSGTVDSYKAAILWCLGERILGPRFQDHAMSHILQEVEFTKSVYLPMVTLAFREALPRSEFRKLCIDAVSKYGTCRQHRRGKWVTEKEKWDDLIEKYDDFSKELARTQLPSEKRDVLLTVREDYYEIVLKQC